MPQHRLHCIPCGEPVITPAFHLFLVLQQAISRQRTCECQVPQNQMQSTVTRIWVAAYPLQNSRVHHWVAFLELVGGRSVKVDMTVSGDESTGLLMFLAKQYVGSVNATYQISFPTIGSPTLQQIFDLITTPDPHNNNRRLDRYRFSAQGNGCAFWTYNFLLRVERAGYLAQGAATQVWNAMQYYYIGGVAQEQVVVQGEREGTFH
jgi:hypothetical protein